ncbi:MAG: diacylglycerol kinase [Novosphingobium pentaromativorans]|uniref:Diacylglycerol kinase n=1 Tax=Novosphingobium pentaromativorans TaxID=205844 RepID=A0A2W5QFM0_9SPHN|nr:MAG: diacylglycerol kinase [Novosphingobium pentaromativorans]
MHDPSPAGVPLALVVHNSDAGTDPVPRADIEAVLQAAGMRTLYCAHGKDDLDAALASPFDLVVCAGGDGTLAHVASSLEQVERPIGVLPLGGSNNIAHALDVEGDWRDLPRRWSLDRWTLLDRCEADGPWGRRRFVEAVGAGLLSDSFDNVDGEPGTPSEKRANGRKAFRTALEKAAPFPCRIEAGDWCWEGDCLMVEVMSIPYVGARLRLAADGDPADGLFDVILVTPKDRARMLAWCKAPDDAPCPIEARRASMVRLAVNDLSFRLDDRSPDERLSGVVTARFRPQPVRILVPARSLSQENA